MLGNAGITSPYGESIFYDPANLQRVGHPNLSVSGRTYLVHQVAVDPIFVLEGEDQPFDASGFVAIPRRWCRPIAWAGSPSPTRSTCRRR